jgi:hypothetical protein
MRAAQQLPVEVAVLPSRRSRGAAWTAWTVALLLGLGMVFGVARLHTFVTSSNAPLAPVPPSPLRAVSDLRQVAITITTPSWTKVPLVVTVDRMRTDHTLWRQMHFGDWDRIAPEFREPALLAMVRSYRPLFAGPAVWRQMPTTQWDGIPQPIRAMAYLRMIWFWARHEALGADFGLSPTRLAATVGAIVMAESWFEHRAVNQNQWGNRDLGLAQCSDHCREVLDQMALEGTIPFTPSTADYFNPWSAVRIATIWFERELLRADGDVDLAIRAYHRGIDNAMDDKGDAYHARVVRLREGYIRTQKASPTWRLLTRTLRPV